MKSKFSRIIINIIIFIIVIIFIVLGKMAFQEWKKIQTLVEVENFETIFSNEETVSNNIKTPQIVENSMDNVEDAKDDVNMDYVQIDKYFYNQLDEYSKIIYQAFESNKENMKTGTYKIELGSAFSKLLSTENGQEELGIYYQSAIEAYTYDNPDVFYLSPNKMYLNIETTTKGKKVTYYVYINQGEESNYLIDEFSSKEQVDEALSRLETIKNNVIQNKRSNTYENIKMVHDLLVNNVEYDTSISQPNIYNIYGALINRKAVCEGYARAFKYLMDGLGIPSTIVIGTGTNSEGITENHAWNYVQLDENWYAIDTTWDDPVSSSDWAKEKSKYKYFLKGENEFNKDHTPSGQFTEGGKMFSYPSISSNNYN
jgi:transglutaminase-like putative cysteine protease